MKHRGLKFLFLLLSLALLVGLLSGMSAYAEFPITIDPVGGGSVSQVSIGDGWYTCTATPAEGYVFQKWTYKTEADIFLGSVSESGSNIQTFIPNTANITAHFMPAVVAVTGVSLDKTEAQSIDVGGKVSFTATVQPDDATDRKVKWSVNGSAVKLYSDADCKTEVGTGATETLTVYAKGISAGTATVTATSNADSTKSASCAVTVKPDGFTVTYVANNGTDEKIEDGPHEEGDYIIQAYDKNFTAPEGKVFDCWKGSDGKQYKNGQTIQLSADLTLTAQWKDKSQGGGSKGGGSGSGGDIVFGFPGASDSSWEYVGGGYAPQKAYRLSFAPMQGGSAYFVLTTGETGETMDVYPQTSVRVVPTPEPGYRLASIVWSMIDGSASYDITEAQTFVMPAMDAVVYVTFQPVG